jgi:flagellar M-ring protein FliF
MDFLNKAFAQLNELFRSMTVGARITAALLLVVVAVSLVYLFRYETSSPDLYLMNGERFSPADLKAAEAAFAAANLGSSYEIDGNRIRVPRGQQGRFMGALADKKAIPNDWFRYLDEGLNGGGSLMQEDRHQREERMKVAKQKELSKIIGSMTGIESAKVFWDSETKQGLTPTTTKTAMVSVRPTASGNLDETQAANIRHLVARAVAGLKYENVGVFDENGGATFIGDESNGSPMDDPYYARKRHAEKEWRTKIQEALAYVRGVKVAVNVELEKELRRREIEQKPDGKGVPYRKTEKSKSKTRDGSAPAGRPGLQANQPQALAPSTGKGSHEEEEETNTTEDSAFGTKSVETEMPGLTPTRVTASINVPMSYFERVWREKNPTPAGEQPKTPSPADLEQVRTLEVANIKASVVGLLPLLEKGGDVTQLVTVTPFQDIAPEPVREPGMPQQVLDWLVRNWSTLGLVLLGMFSLVVLRSMTRSLPAAHVPKQPPKLAAAPESQTDVQAAPQETPTQRRLRRLTAGGLSLRDELTELVAENPDAAANVLRTWIGTVK